MPKKNNLTILYIAGNGHSGSTLLDIIIGSTNKEKIFSAGELTFITRDSILYETCSCLEQIKDCKIWSQVLQIWEKNRTISSEEYIRLRNKFDRNKNFISIFFNDLFPSQEFKTYCDNTLSFFEAIQTVTGKSIIVDSSKVAPRVAMLSKIASLKIIHICRDFSGVLNSAKRNYKKDIAAGYETDLKPRNTFKTFVDWILNNFLVVLFSFNKKTHKLHYKDYVTNIDSLSKIVEISNDHKELTLQPEHLLAGNVLRLKKEIKLNPDLGFKYKRLSARQRQFASIVDAIFFFWAKK